MYTNRETKLITIYNDTKMRAKGHLELLKNAGPKEIIESDRILQYLQETIDCLELCMEKLPKGSETRKQYAMYKDELGELGDEILRLSAPDRW